MKPILYEYKTTSVLLALWSFMAFSCMFPMSASHSKAQLIINTPIVSKRGEIILSASVNRINPKHIIPAAKKSRNPYFFPWIKMLPISTGINLQHLNITCSYKRLSYLIVITKIS